MELRLKIYSDGASRSNPGPSAIAFMILAETGEILKRYSEYVGIRTNNQAEYEALIYALKFASKLTNQEVVCYLDSELVVKHLNGEYRVRNHNLKELWLKVEELKQKFHKTSFIHVPRTERHIEEVDSLANQTLNKATNGCI
ncbi:ribonuclease HI family protein [Candidatus Bathyarchaeota archaeon]|nr:ribonuclease HI family protein [Candidatus Bathyarchaeota archaeon]